MSTIDVAAKKAVVEVKQPEQLVFVSIPAEDNFDFAHPDIIVNGKMYLAGQTYQVSPALAAHIEDRKTKFRKSQVRLNNPSPDAKSQKEMALHGQAKQGSFVSPHSPEFN